MYTRTINKIGIIRIPIEEAVNAIKADTFLNMKNIIININTAIVLKTLLIFGLIVIIFVLIA